MPITQRESGRDALLEALKEPNKTRGIYVRQNGAAYSIGLICATERKIG